MGDRFCDYIKVLKEVGSSFLDCCSEAMGEKKVCYFLIGDWGYVCWGGEAPFLSTIPPTRYCYKGYVLYSGKICFLIVSVCDSVQRGICIF